MKVANYEHFKYLFHGGFVFFSATVQVYKGVLPSGELVAVKRAQEGSMQGANEFKTEIEILSRVHHKNLVGLVGYCYDQGEQMLVYEFMVNGTMREWLAGECFLQFHVLLGSPERFSYYTVQVMKTY